MFTLLVFYAREIKFNECYNSIESNRKENYLLIEKMGAFNDFFRSGLIDNPYLFINDGNDRLGEAGLSGVSYNEGFSDFLKDKHARWLFSILPVENGYTLKDFDNVVECEYDNAVKTFGVGLRADNPKETKEKLQYILRKRKKRIFYIESGHKFGDGEVVNVFTTDHKGAMMKLLVNLAGNIIQKHSKIRFFVIPGPGENYVSRIRFGVAYSFLAKIFEDKNNIPDFGEKNVVDDASWASAGLSSGLRVVQEGGGTQVIPIFSWERDCVIESLGNSEINNNIINYDVLISGEDLHFCVICANDSVALGVYEFIKRKFKEEEESLDDCSVEERVKKLNFSLWGFDGTKEMIEHLEKDNFKGATMAVNHSEINSRITYMCSMLCYSEKMKISLPKHEEISVPAKLIENFSKESS